MVGETEKPSLLRAGMPALLYGMAFGMLGYMAGIVYNVVSATPPALYVGAGFFIFGMTVKLSENL